MLLKQKRSNPIQPECSPALVVLPIAVIAIPLQKEDIRGRKGKDLNMLPSALWELNWETLI